MNKRHRQGTLVFSAILLLKKQARRSQQAHPGGSWDLGSSRISAPIFECNPVLLSRNDNSCLADQVETRAESTDTYHPLIWTHVSVTKVWTPDSSPLLAGHVSERMAAIYTLPHGQNQLGPEMLIDSLQWSDYLAYGTAVRGPCVFVFGRQEGFRHVVRAAGGWREAIKTLQSKSCKTRSGILWVKWAAEVWAGGVLVT